MNSEDDKPPINRLFLRPRREPFEHGLLPIPKLIFTDGIQTLAPLKQRLSERNPNAVVSALSLSVELQISLDYAQLVIDTLKAVDLNCKDDPTDGVDLDDLMLFLYLQSYKKIVPRGHKDSAAVADVWPNISAFDGCLSAMSPLQLVRSNSRRFMPTQADEEAHQLSYLQKHMANILALLSDSIEGEGEDSLILTLEKFVRLEFLIQFGDKRSEGVPLSQAAPFFANSDPDMPAAPVPAAQVHDWVLENIAVSLEHMAEKVAAKENGSCGALDQDVTMVDASATQPKIQSSPSYSRSQTFVEGVSRTSVVKQANDVKGHSIKVVNCHDTLIYILAPLRFALVYGCSDATIVLGAIGKAVRVEHCERIQVIAAAKRICIANCRECVFYLGVNQKPLIVGDNHKIQVAPFNTFYSQLGDHLSQAGIDPNINKWNEPLVLGVIDPHDSLSHPAGVSDVQAESATCLDPDSFTNFLIPNWFGAELPYSTKDNPFRLPDMYLASQIKKHSTLVEIQQALRDVQIDDSRKRDLLSALHAHFKDWLYASGNIHQLYCLQGD